MNPFPPESLYALQTPGVAERWAAVQQFLHPRLHELAEQVRRAASVQMPREWPLYEVSYRSLRYVNKGRGQRAPIEDYFVAFDRPPRGAGVTITVSAAERAVLVGIQIGAARRSALGQLWAGARPVWHALIERIARQGQARFSEPPQRRSDEATALWIERYLANPNAGYLWAGFVYPWEDPRLSSTQLVADVLTLLPFNEALMEQAETLTPLRVLREQPARYSLDEVPPFEVIAERVRAGGFTISDLILRAYHVALQTRPLVIMAGISGTGKTRLTRLYADAIHTIRQGHANPYYLLVSVQPDWHSARDLLGYYNALTGQYQPTALLRFLLSAAADPQQPYYVCLDELNLARPEYYLAPLLSAMETEDGIIDLGLPGAQSEMAGGGTLYAPLRLPPNLCFIGTVNVDESSFALSDKLLDRANLIELTDVDLERFRADYDAPIDPQVWAMITAVQPLTAQAGHAFGYRTINEILRFIERAGATLSPQQALDVQIKQRILPKLRGEDSPRLRQTLEQLLALTLGRPAEASGRHSTPTAAAIASAAYPESAAKLQRMLERLNQDGFTDFYA